MLTISAEQSPMMFEHASEVLGGYYRYERGHKIITALRNDKPIAHAVFTGISPNIKAELTFWAAPHGIAGRDFLRVIFDAAFVQWNCKRLSAIARPSNAKSLAALRGLGFDFEAPLARWFGDEDGWMFRLFPENCRWIKD